MRYLKQNTDQYVTVGAFIDKDDGVTLKDDATATNISGVICKSTHASASTHTDFTCSATGSADWGLTAIGHGGMYDLKIPDSEINFVGSCEITLWYATSYLPVFKEEFMVVPANVWDSLMGTDLLDVSVVQWTGTNVTTPNTAGMPEVNVAKINNVAATSVTAINANQGTTQPVNFTGTGGSALVNAQASGVTVSGTVVLDATQPNYAPSKAGDKMDIVDAPSATGVAVINAAVLSKLLKYVQLLARKDAAIKTDNSTELSAINANGGSGAGAFDNVTDSEEALADAETTINANVLAISTALSPVSQAAGSSTDTTGTVISGTYANTDTADANLWVTAPVNPGGLDMRLNYALGVGRIPVSVSIAGWFNGSGQYVNVYAYDYLNAAWNQLSNSSNRMATRTSTANYSYPLTLQNFDPATGAAIIRFVTTSTTTGNRLSLDRVVVNTVGGATGSTAGLTAEQVWNYITRTLTSNTGEPIDTDALAAALIAAFAATPPKVDVETIKTQAVTCAAGVTVNTNVGTTQPVGFTGTGASALVKSEVDGYATGQGPLQPVVEGRKIAVAADGSVTAGAAVVTGTVTLDAASIAAIQSGLATEAKEDTIISKENQILSAISSLSTGGLAGDGSEDCTIYVKDDNGDPIADADCQIIAVDDPDDDIVASGKTDAFGVIQPHPKLDPGSYEVWRQKVGENFDNPQTIVVPES